MGRSPYRLAAFVSRGIDKVWPAIKSVELVEKLDEHTPDFSKSFTVYANASSPTTTPQYQYLPMALFINGV